MKRYFAIIIGSFVISAVALVVVATQTDWILTQKQPDAVLLSDSGRYFRVDVRERMREPRAYAASAALGDRVYVIGGEDASGAPTTTVQIYEPARDHWSIGPELPSARSGAAAVSVSGEIYVLGGWDVNRRPVRTVWRLDADTNAWEEERSLPAVRTEHAAILVGEDIWVIGGRNETELVRTIHAFDVVQGQWSAASELASGRLYPVAGVIGGRVYVAGGTDPFTRPAAALTVIDPVTGEESEGPTIPTARGQAAGGVIDGALIVVGGEDAQGVSDAVEAYDPVLAQWIRATHLSEPAFGMAAAQLGDYMYFFGGSSSGAASTEVRALYSTQ